MKTTVKYFFLFLFLFCNFHAHTQISVSNTAPYNTANNLVQNVLLGQGITASNISSIGLPQQRGYFNGMNSNIGMDSGFVMTSGEIFDIVPGTSGNGPGMQSTVPANYVSDLVRVSNSAFKMLGQPYSVSNLWDMCVIEFDFIPMGDSLKFNYVFSSDEYLTYVNTQYNDVFAFFLYGPGITPTDNVNNGTNNVGADGNPDFSSYTINGTVFNPKNIAAVPGTNPGLPITISSVHPGLNSQYYINNPSQTTVATNGFTTVLTAAAVVQCGQKYHIRLMVADASDGILNTDVFLEGGSFTSNSTIEISAIPPNILSGTSAGADTALFEQCGPVVLTLVRQGNNSQPATFQINTSGNAVEGVDFSPLPDSITFLPGQDTISISFMPYQDFSADGTETLTVNFMWSSCSNVTTNSISFSIADMPPLTVTSNDQTINCLVNSVEIEVQATGLSPLSYEWSTGAVDTNAITVSPATTTDYFVTITDGCGVNTQVETVTVNVENDSIMLQSTDDTVSCVSPDVLIEVQVLSGISPYSYVWSNGATTDSTTVTPSDSTTDYYVTVTDACGLESQTDTITVTVLSQEVQLLTNDTTTTCPGDPVQIEANPSGGYPPYTTWWAMGGDSILFANPQTTTTYTAYVIDACNVSAVATATVNVTQYPQLIVDAGSDDTLHCPGDTVKILPSASGGSGGYIFSWTDWTDTKDTLLAHPLSSYNYVVAVFDNCSTDTVYDTVTVFVPDYPPVLAFEPGEVHSCPGEPVSLKVNVTGGEGTYFYQWSASAGTSDSMIVSPTSSANYSVIVSDLCGNSDTAYMNVSIEVPNADFTFDLREDNSVIFSNNSTLADTFFWDFGDGGSSTEKDPVYSYKLVFEYEVVLYVESEYGCSDTAVRKIIPPMQIWIPNAFTPNEDELNDVFQLSGIGIDKFLLRIFDRWGDLIFQSDNISNSWDGKTPKGKLLPGDVYIYKITAEGLKGEKFKKMGSITLVR